MRSTFSSGRQRRKRLWSDDIGHDVVDVGHVLGLGQVTNACLATLDLWIAATAMRYLC